MAIDLTQQYPQQVDASTPEYPLGKARNVTSIDDNNATPLDAGWMNDHFGFFQALLTAAGIVPNGSPDNAVSSQYLDAIRVLATGGSEAVYYDGLKDSVGSGRDYKVVTSRTPGGDSRSGGVFAWASGDQSQKVLQDPMAGVYVAPSSDPTGESGAWFRVSLSRPTPMWWGVTDDGVTDYTEALREYHAYCNRTNEPASYAGLTKLAIQADAQIIVNTDWDYNNVTPLLLNGIVPVENWVKRLVTFRVFDPDCVYTTRSTPTFVTANLKKGSYQPTKGYFDDAGYVYVLDGGTRVSGRQFGNPTERYSQSFHIVGNGQTTQALSRTLSNTTDVTTGEAPRMLYRRNSARGNLKIKNVKFVFDGSFNFQHIIVIERNNVFVDHVTVDMPSYAQAEAVNQLIRIYGCAKVGIANLQSNGLPTNNGSGGGYVLAIDYAADVFLDNIQTTDNTNTGNGWGWIGTNHVNGLYVSRSSVGRIDGHAGIHNVFVDKTTFTDVGVTYGWGGGTISVSQCRLLNSSAVYARVDYGNSFYGTVDISNVTIVESMGTARALYSCKHIGSSNIVTRAPEVININGVTVQKSEDLAYSTVYKNNTVELIALIPDVDASTSSTQPHVYAPQTINVSNIHACNNVDFLVNLSLGSFSVSGNQVKVNIDSLTANKVLFDFSLKFDTVANVAGKTPCRIFAELSNISTFAGVEIESGNYPFENLDLSRIGRLNKLAVPANATRGIQSVINIRACHIYNYTGDGRVFGNTSDGTARHRTALFNCTYDSGANFVGAGAIQGLIGRGSITLPPTVTTDMAFKGWANFGLPAPEAATIPTA